MDLKELKQKFDKAYNNGQENREKAADDMFFCWVSQWDDGFASTSPLKYRGQFDVVRKAVRKVLSDLRANPVQPDFKPKDDNRTDDAELLDGIYRAEDRALSSQEAYDYACQDAVVCGFGAWELYTDYVSNRAAHKQQTIRRSYIPEACTSVFFDPSSVALDKSDANYVFILRAYSEDGYKNLVEELTGERPEDIKTNNFAQPDDGIRFRWVTGDAKYYIGTCYIKKMVNDVILTMADPFGDVIKLRKSDIEKVIEELADGGFEIMEEKRIKRWEVRKYICSGEKILNGDIGEVIPGDNLPVVPVYGERSIIQGQEQYEGIVRLAKDPQRLRNFSLSYLHDIVGQSPRPKPIFFPEQLSNLENMYSNLGEQNYPYYLVNRLSPDGTPLPAGPVAQLPEQTVPQALIASIELTRQAVEDVANPGVPQNIADPDLSGKAVLALQSSIDQQSYIYQHNFKFAKRRDAEIFAGMAVEIFDAPRTVSIETPDGTRKQVQIMQSVIDKETGNPVVLNDVTNMEFDVYADIGQSFQSQKEQSRERLGEMIGLLDPADPMRKTLMLTLLENVDGINLKHVRDLARKQLILEGVKEPETEEEAAMLQAQQSKEAPQDPAMVLAMAEQQKAQAQLIGEQRQAQKDAVDAANNNAKTQIEAFNAETRRMDSIIKSEEANAKINKMQFDEFDKRVQNAANIQSGLAGQLRSSLTQAKR